MIIDANMHWHPEILFKDEKLINDYLRITRASGQIAEYTTIPGSGMKQIVISEPKGCENLNLSEIVVDTQARLEAMKAAKVDKAILRVSCFQGWINLELCRRLNDEMAKCIRENPGKFYGLVATPPWGDPDSMYEMERCIKELGFVGVLGASHYGNRYLDEEELRPFFIKINALGVPVCIHHASLPVEYQSIVKYVNLRRPVGRCIEQLTSVGRVLFSDLLDECPNIKMIYTMMGGGFHAFLGQIAPKKSEEKEDMDRFDLVAEKIRAKLSKNIYFDITTPQQWSKPQLEDAVRELGADHILFSSSYPVRREWLVKGADYVRSLNISDKDKELIMGGNAQRLFKIK